ncbi:MAG: DUF2339 domain-containing protein [Gemmatimonadales bacterium]
MGTDPRFDDLERRVQTLEQLARELVRRLGPSSRQEAPQSTPPPPPPPADAPVTPEAAPSEVTQSPSVTTADAPPAADAQRPARRAPELTLSGRWGSSMPAIERWLGLQGLLAVGVAALIVAAAYLLKLAFEEGWISPTVRTIVGIIAGGVLAIAGWRWERRGLRIYGAALIGAGAAIVYLAMWAATFLNELVSPGVGLAGLALVALALAAVAVVLDIEALGATAAAGVLVAPLLVDYQPVSPNQLLLYLAVMGGSLGWVTARVRRWRLATGLVAAGYFGLVSLRAAGLAMPALVLGYASIGGALGLLAALRHRWWETRFLSFLGGWTLLTIVAPRLEPAWLFALGGVVLAAPIWRQALSVPSIFGDKDGAGAWTAGEAGYFFLTPLLLFVAVITSLPDDFAYRGGLAAIIVAVPYLGVGYRLRRIDFTSAGAGMVVLGVLTQFDGLVRTRWLLGLSVVWAALDRPLARRDGRWISAGMLLLAVLYLVGQDANSRPASGAAFVDGWAVTLWITVVLAALLAWRKPPSVEAEVARTWLWVGSGVALFVGVSRELVRFFGQSRLAPADAALASGLAVSAWWLTFATMVVLAGFRLGQRAVRVVGVVVVFLALLKIVLWDLSALEALYRVASVFLLGLVSLFVAFLYHRAEQRHKLS